MANNAQQLPISIEKILEEYRPIIDQHVEKWCPRKFTAENIPFFSGKPSYRLDHESATKAISEPIWEILDRGGKRWRPALMLLVSEALGPVSTENKQAITDLVGLCELIHNGSLIIDDIEDSSELRRGKPCLHHIYGTDLAINAGNAMYFLPLIILRELGKQLPPQVVLKLYESWGQECINLHFGQGLDIFWHQGKSKTPTVDEYLQMCAFKTGTLARLSVKLSMIVVGATESQVEMFGKFGEAIGVAFQIQDDILNLVGENFTTSVTGEDISEGKRSLMVIHFCHNAAPEKAERLLHILKLHTRDRQLIEEAIAMLKEFGSIDFARKVGKDIIVSAWQQIEPFVVDTQTKAKMKAFADYLITRDI
eukprot:TRINITY_DN2358_c0_g1_i1.p1 TRINITY_DN2358_c0_g1~~TRINITY_DN2358_c0_g1_i1.p1  ORF type:complete len:382 (-),score=118.06 TRINITY_DN2358_c0_g1_i1:171-1268(-)